MKLTRSISWRNVTRRPARSVGLSLIAALLSFTVFAGTMVSVSLSRGLDSLEERLGADIMVVPYQATTHTDFSLENMVLSGATGYFYMDDSAVEEISQVEGIQRISTQFFLASAKASCCSARVQIIGFDPKTDFTITPWIKTSVSGDLGELDVIVGNDLNAFVGDDIYFYGTTVHVVGKLAATGTSLDTAVYTTNDTVKDLIRSADEQGFYDFNFDPDTVTSCVLIDVADEAVIEEVANYINIHVKGVQAVQTKGMTSEVSEGLVGVTNMIRLLVIVVWVLAVTIMVVAFRMITNERKREFGILRIIGASRRKLASIILCEAAIVSSFGAIVGVACGMVVIFSFGTLIEKQLALPFLTPGIGYTALVSLIALMATVAVGSAASAGQAVRISHADTSLILRGDT